MYHFLGGPPIHFLHEKFPFKENMLHSSLQLWSGSWLGQNVPSDGGESGSGG